MPATNNLIYQYWDGNLTPGVEAGIRAMKIYADRIGADYLFEHNPKFVTHLGKYSPHYGQFKVAYSLNFRSYNNILFCDTDVFPVDSLQDNIFEQLQGAELGICTEPHQPEIRATNTSQINKANDDAWANIVKNHYGADVARTADGLVKVYNSGVVLYNESVLQKIRDYFEPFADYVNTIKNYGLPPFYTCDQPYLHAMIFAKNINYIELDNGWNRIVHFIGPKDIAGNRAVYDKRDSNTKFVHIQLSDADNFDANKLWRITNMEQRDWNL